MQFEQIYYPFSETASNKEISSTSGKNNILYLGIFLLLIGGGAYVYNKLTYQTQSK